MSRVRPGNKHLNLPKPDARYNAGPVIIVQPAKDGSTYIPPLSEWRFQKYGITTKSWRRKSPARKAELRAEYEQEVLQKENRNERVEENCE